MKTVCFQKDTAMKIKRKSQIRKTIILHQVYDNLYSKYKEFSKLSNKKIYNLTLKTGRKYEQHFAKEDTKMANKHIKIRSITLAILEIQVEVIPFVY